MIKLGLALGIPAIVLFLWFFLHYNSTPIQVKPLKVGEYCDGTSIYVGGPGSDITVGKFIEYVDRIRLMKDDRRKSYVLNLIEIYNRICQGGYTAEPNLSNLPANRTQHFIIVQALYQITDTKDLRKIFSQGTSFDIWKSIGLALLCLLVIFLFGIGMVKYEKRETSKRNWANLHQSIFAVCFVIFAGSIFYKDPLFLRETADNYQGIVITTSTTVVVGILGFFSKSLQAIYHEIID